MGVLIGVLESRKYRAICNIGPGGRNGIMVLIKETMYCDITKITYGIGNDSIFEGRYIQFTLYAYQYIFCYGVNSGRGLIHINDR